MSARPPVLAEQAAQAEATRLINSVQLPPKATRAASAPSPLFKGHVNGGPLTPYVVSRTRFWTAPGTRDGVAAFFTRAYQQPVSGTYSDHDQEAVEIEVGSLILSVAQVGDTRVGIRADANVVWTPPKPATEQMAGDVQSVELLAYRQGQTDRALARRTVTGTSARHLADLTNQLERDKRGLHGCLADVTGLRERLTFSSPSQGTVVIDGFFCGSVSMTVNGALQPPLQLTQELQQAVATELGPLPGAPGGLSRH